LKDADHIFSCWFNYDQPEKKTEICTCIYTKKARPALARN